jgi:magnesium chelatase family protein
MTLAIVYTRANSAITAPLVTVEVHISRGMPNLHMVGLPEAEVKESRFRVRSALLNAQFEFPARRITINLAPADLPKEGGRFDLPIALGILAASGQLPLEKLAQYEFIGELALSGELRAVKGVLPIVLGAHQAKRMLIVPRANSEEAALVRHAEVFSAEHLLDVCAHLRDENKLQACEAKNIFLASHAALDLVDVRGQTHAKRALEIAAAGKHSLILMGPPGTGKTMLASRLPGILPPLSEEQAIEIAAVASVSNNGFDTKTWQQIPFRSPHHSSSSVALVGGGRPPKPGEISLAHHGVLFLDELTEFNRHVLESLREPLESGQITISRAAYQSIFPAQFQLVAAMNPCPCGYFGSAKDNCRCTEQQVQRYLAKLSGPLLDRVDLQIQVPSLSSDLLSKEMIEQRETSQIVKDRVCRARQRQMTRQKKSNAELTVKELKNSCELDSASEQLLTQVVQKFNLSARVYHRILKVSRNIADLMESDTISVAHVGEALSYRSLDRTMLPNQA